MPKSDGGALSILEHSPSHLLHRALQLALDIYAEETGPSAITQRQFAVLAAVASQEGLTQSKLVAITGIDRSTLADMIARMAEKSLLSRRRSPTDARANTVALTLIGRQVLEDAMPKVAAVDARIINLVSASKRDVLIKLLREFVRAPGTEFKDEPHPKIAKEKKAKNRDKDADKKKKKKHKKLLAQEAN